MAGDWIKMRTSLGTHPQVVRISSALKADRLRVIGGLHAVWSLFDTHSEDGTLPGYSLFALDDAIGWQGFGAALAQIGWLIEGEDALIAVDFDEHNGQSAKRRAMETERKRKERAEKEAAEKAALAASASDADKSGTKSGLEKRREEKRVNTKDTAPPVGDADLFPDVDPQVVADFRALRKRVKAEITPTAMKRIATEAEKAGMTLQAALEVCCSRGWRGFEASWVAPRGPDRRNEARPGSERRSHGDIYARNAEAVEEIIRKEGLDATIG